MTSATRTALGFLCAFVGIGIAACNEGPDTGTSRGAVFALGEGDGGMPDTGSGLGDDPTAAHLGPSIETDKLDYLPGETALISGSGWPAGATISLEVDHHDVGVEPGAGHTPWTVVADADGTFETTWYVDPDDSLGQLFTLSADAGEIHVEVSFTDAATTYVRNLTESGWYNPFHDPGNGNYYVGSGYHDFFVFDLSGITGTVVSARIQARGYCSSASGTFTLYDVSTPIASLVAGGHRPDIHADLGSGTQLGSTFTPGSHMVNVPFNSAGLAAVQAAAGRAFAVGGRFSGPGFILGCTRGYPSAPADVQLIVTTQNTDTTAPVLSLPAPITGEATSAAGLVVTFSATAVDAVDGPRPVSCVPASGTTFAIGTTTVLCNSADLAGNLASGSFTVTIRDTTPPVIDAPPSQTLEATSGAGAVATFTASATDVHDGAVEVVCDHASGSTFALGTTTVVCTATDSSGNVASASFAVEVVDTTAPILETSGEVRVELTQPAGAPADFSARATDVVDGDVAVDCAPASGTVFPLGTTIVQCEAHDARGNRAVAEVRVVVADTVAPALTVPADMVLEATGRATPVDWTIEATDLSDSVVSFCDPGPGSFPLGTHTVVCHAFDASGNASSAQFTITVADTTPPAIEAPPPLTLEATGPCATVADFPLPIAQDLHDGAIPARCEPAPGSAFCLGATGVYCTAVDASGNVATAYTSVTVVDTTPPVLSVPAAITLEATGPSGAVATFAATATDTHDGAIAVSCDRLSGSTFALGATVVTCTARDASGNEAAGAFTIRVADTTAPVVTPPGDASAIATSTAGAVVAYGTGSATDAVSGSIVPTCAPASGSTFSPGTTVVTCRATDAAGNTGSATFRVTVTFGWSGFLQPINLDGSSLFRGGRTVPVKFRLSGPSAGITTLLARLYVAKISNGVVGTDEEVTSTSSADTGNTFRYSPTDDVYIFNLATRGYSDGTYQLRADLGDGVTRTVLVSIRR